MTTHKPFAATVTAAGDGLDAAAQRADGAIQATRDAANVALDTLQSGVDAIRDAGPGTVSRAAARADELARRGIERARIASTDLRERLHDAGDRTRAGIREEPVKSMLIAAAAGAAAAALIGWLARSRARELR